MEGKYMVLQYDTEENKWKRISGAPFNTRDEAMEFLVQNSTEGICYKIDAVFCK